MPKHNTTLEPVTHSAQGLSRLASRRSLALAGILGSILLLSACGGGGGGDGTTGAIDQVPPGASDPGTSTPGTSGPDTIYLAVRAVDFSGQNGPYSDEASARIEPGQEVTLVWQAPNTTVDGTGCTSVAEYVVSLGTTSNDYSEHVMVGSSSTALNCQATSTNSCGNVYTCELDFTVPSV
jgi:hypothetical protein